MSATWLIPSVYAALGAACVIPPLRIAHHLCSYVSKRPKAGGAISYARAAVILPCKGIASELEDLEQNLRAIVEQDYPSYRVIFAIGTPDDLAAPTIRRLCERYPHAELVVAEHKASCSQKVSNQLAALERLGNDEEVLVFVDSDARPAAGLLKQLGAPLTDAGVGATTGFRWYIPSREQGGFGSWLRAAWNAGGMPFLVEPRYNYAWGGAMAVRRDVFERCGIAEYWREALSDDLGLSLLVKKAGLRIHWVPECLVPSPENLTLPQAVEWTTRQTVVCRVYNPVMWRDALLGEAFTGAVLLAGAAGVAGGMLSGNKPWWVGGLLAIFIVVAGRMAYQQRILSAARRLAPQLLSSCDRLRLIALAPLVHPLMLFNSVRSGINRRITWRGITYHLRGERDIVILRRDCPH